MMVNEEITDKERYLTIRAARELGYPNSVVQKLKVAKSGIEMDRIMKTARERTPDEIYGNRH